MAEKLRVLMVEDAEEDALLILRELCVGGFEVVHEQVETRQAFLKAVKEGNWDLILADYRLPAYSGLDALKDLKASGRDLPFILISGTIDQETAVDAMRTGAHDYLMKGDLGRMVPAVRRELREAKERRQHRAAEVALAESEERYRQLVENAHEAIYVVQDGKIVFANAMCGKLVRQPVAELMGRPVIDFTPEEDREKLLDHHEKVLRGEALEGPEDLRFRPPGGDGERWLAVSAVRIEWNGRPATLNFATDITEHKRAEDEIRDSEARFRSLIDSMSNFAVQGYGPDGTVHYWNHASEAVYGYSKEEALGQNLVDLIIPPAMREQVCKTLREGATTGEIPPAEELELMRKDGSPVHVFCSHTVVRVAGREPEMFCLDVDITGRKRAEMDLRRQSMAIEQAAEAVVIVDSDATILYTNPAFEKITGYARAEALGQNPRILKSGKQDAEFYRRMWALLTDGQVWSGHFINKRKDGTLYEEDASISPVRDAAGRIVNYVAVKRDVTQEMALQAQLLQSQKLETVGQLAAGIAHDFNNLLMVFGGCASLLLKKLPEDTPVRSLVEEIRRAVNRGSGMTQQLLSLSRQQMGHPQPHDLNQFVGEVLKIARHLALEHVEIVARPSPLPLWVVTDHSQLLQVLMNLIVNARDAMKEGGILRIETTPCTLSGPDSRFPSAPPGDYAIFTIADTGCGMSPEVQARIFEPFFTTKERGKGTGLGLAIAHSIVHQNKGHLHVRSRVGEGSEFSILLPQCPVPTVQGTADKAVESPSRGTETVLLAEDDPKVRAVVRRILREQGYRVVVAKDGAEALRRFEAHPSRFPILLSDVAMPRLNGLELARKVRRLDPRVRVILISGYSDTEVMQQVLNEKDIPFLPKPVNADLLLRRIRESLGAPPVVKPGNPIANRAVRKGRTRKGRGRKAEG